MNLPLFWALRAFTRAGSTLHGRPVAAAISFTIYNEQSKYVTKKSIITKFSDTGMLCLKSLTELNRNGILSHNTSFSAS